ncbi:high mobility group B protein 2-like [Lycium ferocissimum]|uniref:high mobility group B protein 2-like n=1 Tax=Lycium ferocissimum TaxID=112874 RepID=UPI0028167B8B|nr:high mobility group B protein 2-like [Lycium ferocissimum]
MIGCKCVLGLKKKSPEAKEVRKASKYPDRPKRPASAFYVRRGRKACKDPNKPKRPACAFLIFMKEFRKQLKKENSKTKSVAAASIAGGGKWKQLSDAEKAPYVAEAKRRMEEYFKKRDAYYNKGVAAGCSKEKESAKSMSEVDEEEEDDD